MLMGFGSDSGQVFDPPQDIWILHNDTAGLAINGVEQPHAIGFGGQVRQGGIECVARILRHRLGNADIMRVQPRRQHCLCPLGNAASHADCLPACSGAVIHRRIGNIAAEQSRNLRLEFEQHL